MQSFLVKISDYLIQNVFKRIIATRMKIIAYVLRFVTIAITLLIIGKKLCLANKMKSTSRSKKLARSYL